MFFLNLFYRNENNESNENGKYEAMTSLILDNADLNNLFPKCRPRNGNPPDPGAIKNQLKPVLKHHHHLNERQFIKQQKQQQQKNHHQELSETIQTSPPLTTTTNSVVTGVGEFFSTEMIDLEHDNTDR